MEQQRIFDIIFKEDEVTWQAILENLVKVENMDPWDLDVSNLTFKYIEMLKEMQKMDLRISGKVVLAAAILLKIKSNYLMGVDFMNFDRLMNPDEYSEDALYENGNQKQIARPPEDLRLFPKTPQPRKRKVSIYELVDALKQALEVTKRRRQILDSIEIKLPEKKIDIGKLIEEIFSQITAMLSSKEFVTFNEIVPSGKKEDKISVFIPLLHLSNQRRIDLEQQVHFGEIDISLPKEEERRTGSAVNEVANLDKSHDFIEDALDESDKKRRKKNVHAKRKSSDENAD